ncbi:hypothetical protein KCU65_g6543, partial [Aureobasidium melanogenum]
MTDSPVDPAHGQVEGGQRLPRNDTRNVPYNQRMNDLMIGNMKKYTDMSVEEVDEFAYFLVAMDYFRLPDHRGGAIIPGSKHYRMDGTEHTLADVNHRIVVQEIENQIKKQPEDRRTEMYRKVIEGVKGAKKDPDWERPAIEPNKDPTTPFSTSKASDAKSNQQLIDDLASALGMSDRTKGMVQAQIIHRDASGDEKRPAFIMFGGPEGGHVSGGRLGRDHKLTDVPNHFVRDSIMDYIDSQVEEDKKKDARAAVFSDLSPSEIAAYSATISASKDEERRKETEQEQHYEDILNTMENHKPKPKSLDEALNIIQQRDLLDKIPHDDLDLTQPGNHGHFDTDFEGVFKSVVKPGSQKLPYEAETRPPLEIDLDCDQIRACIKRFTRNGIWSVDQFRLTLGQIARPELTMFLGLRGPGEGRNLRVRTVCWQFFKWREVLGLDMTKSSQDDIKKIQEKGKKRAAGGDDQTPGKKQKPSTAEWLEAARESAMGVQRSPTVRGGAAPRKPATPIDLTQD